MKKGLEQLQKGKGVRTKMLNIKDILSFIVFQSRTRPKTQFFLTFICLEKSMNPEVALGLVQITE